MLLKVVLPTGEVNVNVEPNSTPGHLKENLKYSLKVPPKCIRLMCEGQELDDIKPLTGEPNNIEEGAVLVAEAKEGAVEEDDGPKGEGAKRTREPTVIKKEEPPRPKKVKKDDVRPELVEGDVVKKEVLSPGRYGWSPKYLEAKCAKRHLASFKVEIPDEKKSYPEDDGTMMIALGDPQTSPVWTAVAQQMDIGEKAVFTMTRKAVDFDPEGLNPTDPGTVIVELLEVIDVDDVDQDFQQLLHIETPGSSDRAEDLDRVAVHWRVRRWMAEGLPCVASSRERIAILPGYGLVPIEDQRAPPVTISVGEGQQEAMELIASRLGPGGSGHVYLKSEALKSNRPAGCVVVDVEFVAMDPNRGPGTSGWMGLRSLVAERETGDQWLDEADGRRKQLETFGVLRKSTDDSKEAEDHVRNQVHKFANNAARRYTRALRWLEADNPEEKKIKQEKVTLCMRLAKANALAHQRFGEALEKQEATAEEKAALKDALELLGRTLETCEAMGNEAYVVECLKMTLQVCIQSEDVSEARKVLQRLQELTPDDDDLKSDNARINRLEGQLTLKQGANTVEDMQKELQEANTAVDKDKIKDVLGRLLALMKDGKVTYDTIRTCKVGKDVGNSMKLGDPDLAAEARKVVGEIQALAQRNSIGM